MRFELLKILMVDDNHHMRLLLTEILRAIGVKEVFEASNGAEALQTLRKHPIDIVMTDLAMQPLDGIDLVRRLRNASGLLSEASHFILGGDRRPPLAPHEMPCADASRMPGKSTTVCCDFLHGE